MELKYAHILGSMIWLVSVDIVMGYGAFFAGYNKNKSQNNRPGTNSASGRQRHSPYRHSNSPPASVFCKYGQFSHGCCEGWELNAIGQCQPKCNEKCVHGTCVGPNRCRCDSGWMGQNCNEDLNECAVHPCQHRCMNEPGSYRCYCEHGYLLLADGISCSADDRCYATRCAFGCVQYHDGFKCYCPSGLSLTSDGLGCQDIDECAMGLVECDRGRRCVNTYGNYICLCPEGYHFAFVDGSIQCVDMDECRMNMHRCDENAHCLNANSGYRCDCNEGFVGDGYKCIELDDRLCNESPCFPGVECMNVKVNKVDVNIDDIEVVRSFSCGECPNGLAGDGVECAPSITDLRILVTDPSDNDLRIQDATVSIFDQTENGKLVTRGRTDADGVAILQVPMFSDLIITADKDSYLQNSESFQVVPNRNNFLTIRVTRATMSKNGEYDPNEETLFRFRRTLDDDYMGEVKLPRGALDVASGTSESAFIMVPDPTQPADVNLAPILHIHPKSVPRTVKSRPKASAQKAAETSNLVINGRNPSTKRRKGQKAGRRGHRRPIPPPPHVNKVEIPDQTITKFPMDTVVVAYISIRDGEGDINGRLLQPATVEIPIKEQDDRNLQEGDTISVWQYDSKTGLWKPDTTGVVQSSSQTDGLVFTYQSTHLGWMAAGEISPNIRKLYLYTCYDDNCNDMAPNIPLWLHGMDSVYVESVLTDTKGRTVLTVREGSKISLQYKCDGEKQTFNIEEDTRRLYFKIPGPRLCTDPGFPDNGARFGDDFTFGTEVTYFCDPGFLKQGSSRRVCDGCGHWSGYQPVCMENTDSSFSSVSAEVDLDSSSSNSY